MVNHVGQRVAAELISGDRSEYSLRREQLRPDRPPPRISFGRRRQRHELRDDVTTTDDQRRNMQSWRAGRQSYTAAAGPERITHRDSAGEGVILPGVGREGGRANSGRWGGDVSPSRGRPSRPGCIRNTYRLAAPQRRRCRPVFQESRGERTGKQPPSCSPTVNPQLGGRLGSARNRHGDGGGSFPAESGYKGTDRRQRRRRQLEAMSYVCIDRRRRSASVRPLIFASSSRLLLLLLLVVVVVGLQLSRCVRRHAACKQPRRQGDSVSTTTDHYRQLIRRRPAAPLIAFRSLHIRSRDLRTGVRIPWRKVSRGNPTGPRGNSCIAPCGQADGNGN